MWHFDSSGNVCYGDVKVPEELQIPILNLISERNDLVRDRRDMYEAFVQLKSSNGNS